MPVGTSSGSRSIQAPANFTATWRRLGHTGRKTRSVRVGLNRDRGAFTIVCLFRRSRIRPGIQSAAGTARAPWRGGLDAGPTSTVWGHAASMLTRTVDTHVAELRRKL